MVEDLFTIQRPISSEIQRFEVDYLAIMTEAVAPLKNILHYVSEVHGKRLRPLAVFLSARLFGEVAEVTYQSALFVEMLHTATLIHDDIVDDSDLRRGRDSLHVRWNKPSAVLAGDYILAKAISLLATPEALPILKEMLGTALSMSEGELSQKIEDGSQKTEGAYLELIERKTALLFRSCCVAGAMSVKASETEVQLLADFGLNLGLVFQMRDDILDNDDPESTRFAEKLMPVYLEKALHALEKLNTAATNQQILNALHNLTLFCAQRNA